MIVGPALIVGGGDVPQILPGSALRVVGAHIAALGPYRDVVQAFPDDPIRDTGSRVIVPGFVNALVLTHAVLAEGLAGYGGLAPPWRELEQELTADDLHVSALAALVQGLRHGVTTSYLHCAAYGAAGAGLAAVARAAGEIKVRVAISGSVTDRHGETEAAVLLDENAALVEQAKKGWGDRLRALLGVGALSEVSAATLERVAARARALGAGVFALAGSDESDTRDARERHGTTPMGRLAREGLLDARSIIGPASHLPAPDWELLGASGAVWVSTPREDIERHGRSHDYLKLAGSRIVPALGTGSLAPDPLAEAVTVYRSARLHGHPAAAGKALAARTLFERAADLMQRHFVPGQGHLLPGSPADLVVLDAYPATPVGGENWTDHLVQSLAAAPIHSVMVAGETLWQEGRATMIDEREIQGRARAAVQRLWPRVAP